MIYSQIPIIGFQFKKDTVLWKVTCTPVKICYHFREACCFHVLPFRQISMLLFLPHYMMSRPSRKNLKSHTISTSFCLVYFLVVFEPPLFAYLSSAFGLIFGYLTEQNAKIMKLLTGKHTDSMMQSFLSKQSIIRRPKLNILNTHAHHQARDCARTAKMTMYNHFCYYACLMNAYWL